METSSSAVIVTRDQLDTLARLAETEGLPHPSAPGVTWQTLRNLGAVR